MWILTRQSDGLTVHLLCNKQYVIGRARDCDIIIGTDQSVSRKHLAILSNYEESNLGSIPEIKVQDLGSSSGTFVNVSGNESKKLSPQKWTAVSEGAEIKIGEHNTWTLSWENVSVTCSSLVPADIGKLRNCLLSLGGKMLSVWTESSTHLAISKIVFTQKTLEALVSAKPIVSVDFFEKWVDKLKSSPQPPKLNFADFLPPVQDTGIAFGRSVFLPNPSRKKVFSGKVFLFPDSKVEEVYRSAISLGEGKPHVLEKYQRSKLDAESTVLIEWTKKLGKPSELYLAYLGEIKEKGQRAVPERDIGYAIAECSVQRYCNPFPVDVCDKVFATVVDRKQEEATQPLILAPETQAPDPTAAETTTRPGNSKRKVLDESQQHPEEPLEKKPLVRGLAEEATQQMARKRKLSNEETSSDVVVAEKLTVLETPGKAANRGRKRLNMEETIIDKDRDALPEAGGRINANEKPSRNEENLNDEASGEVSDNISRIRSNETGNRVNAAQKTVFPSEKDFASTTSNTSIRTPQSSKNDAENKTASESRADKRTLPTVNAAISSRKDSSRNVTSSSSSKTSTGYDLSQLLNAEEFGKRLSITSDRPRIRQMRVARFRDGQWITDPEVIVQSKPPPKTIFNVSRL